MIGPASCCGSVFPRVSRLSGLPRFGLPLATPDLALQTVPKLHRAPLCPSQQLPDFNSLGYLRQQGRLDCWKAKGRPKAPPLLGLLGYVPSGISGCGPSVEPSSSEHVDCPGRSEPERQGYVEEHLAAHGCTLRSTTFANTRKMVNVASQYHRP